MEASVKQIEHGGFQLMYKRTPVSNIRKQPTFVNVLTRATKGLVSSR